VLFRSLIVANLGLILTNRSWSRTIVATLSTPNAALWWVLSGAVVFLGLVLSVPFLQRLFRLGVLDGPDLALCAGAGLLGIALFEALKLLRRAGPTR
jgi:Ca2+-transporting ATPase